MIDMHIELSDQKFKSTLIDLARLFRLAKVTVFTGAGVSVPSGLPDSNRIVMSIAAALLTSLNQLNLGTSEDRQTAIESIKQYRLERILDAIIRFHGNQGLNVLSVLQSSRPNYIHRAVALLVANNYLRNLVTLNFDVLFETALRELGVSFRWQLPLASVVEQQTTSPSLVTVTKPHGTLMLEGATYADHFLAANLQYAGDHPQEENIRAFDLISQESPNLFVCGYSNGDWDITPILKSTPWERVYWVQHSEEPSSEIIEWLDGRPFGTSWLMRGDVQLCLHGILTELDINFAKPSPHTFPRIQPDASFLLSNRAATALSALSLIDAKKNTLYTSMLAQIGETKELILDQRLRDLWERAMAWSHHAHEGNPHKAIDRYRKVITKSSQSDFRDQSRLHDCVSMYYEHISTLKQPYLNRLLLVDLYYVHKWRCELLLRANSIGSSDEGNPWVKKEALRILALTRFYVVDLYHNLGYHLLLFSNRLARSVTKMVFSRIALLYDAIAREQPNIDWEYHFVRRVEAHLIAHNVVDDDMNRKLTGISKMFDRTDQFGHYAYTKSVLAVIQSDYAAFISAKKLMTDPRGAATPSGILRMILFQRYFWPEKVSGWKTLRSLLSYLKARKSL